MLSFFYFDGSIIIDDNCVCHFKGFKGNHLIIEKMRVVFAIPLLISNRIPPPDATPRTGD